jgi:hypothetical protein
MLCGFTLALALDCGLFTFVRGSALGLKLGLGCALALGCKLVALALRRGSRLLALLLRVTLELTATTRRRLALCGCGLPLGLACCCRALISSSSVLTLSARTVRSLEGAATWPPFAAALRTAIWKLRLRRTTPERWAMMLMSKRAMPSIPMINALSVALFMAAAWIGRGKVARSTSGAAPSTAGIATSRSVRDPLTVTVLTVSEPNELPSLEVAPLRRVSASLASIPARWPNPTVPAASNACSATNQPSDGPLPLS